jgi:undecaprenyl phosphate-alpha-L-ara4FN deformylase
MSYAGLRIDIDCVRDAEMLPVLLDMLNGHGIKATFFVSTGPDNIARNIKNCLNPLNLIRKKAFKRYGLTIFNGLIFKRQVQESKTLDLILDAGHELGLHGYDHYNWMKDLDSKSREEISALISRGCELFEQALGFYPKSFASPGFTVNSSFLSVLDDFGFRYSSDFIAEQAFYPEIGGKVCRTLQIPVSMRSFGELNYDGLSNNQILKVVMDRLSRSSPFVLYCHPSYEPVFKPALLERVLKYIESRSKIITLEWMASRLKGSIRKHENSAHL